MAESYRDFSIVLEVSNIPRRWSNSGSHRDHSLGKRGSHSARHGSGHSKKTQAEKRKRSLQANIAKVTKWRPSRDMYQDRRPKETDDNGDETG